MFGVSYRKRILDYIKDFMTEHKRAFDGNNILMVRREKGKDGREWGTADCVRIWIDREKKCIMSKTIWTTYSFSRSGGGCLFSFLYIIHRNKYYMQPTVSMYHYAYWSTSIFFNNFESIFKTRVMIFSTTKMNSFDDPFNMVAVVDCIK